MVFHCSLTGRELPGWSRCMSPALLTSFLNSAFLFYILTATAKTNYDKKCLPLVSILVYLVPPATLGLHPYPALPSLPTGAPFPAGALLHPGELVPSTNPSTRHTTSPPRLEGKSKWIAAWRRDKTWQSLLLGSGQANKASNEDNDEQRMQS